MWQIPLAMIGSQVAGQVLASKGQKQPVPQVQNQGYAAMPTQVQDYLRRANTPLYNLNMPNAMQNMNRYPVALGQANMPGQSQALAALQAANPNHNLNYMGMEPMNAAQIRALQEAQMSGMPGSLAAYMQPFEKEREARLRGVNRTFDEYAKKINEEDALINSQISPASNMQLRQQQERIAQNRANAIGDVEGLMEGRAFDRAREYRNQSLEQMLRAGDIQQQFGQQLANNATGYNLTANQPGYGHSLAMNTLAAPYFGSGLNVGAQEGRVNNMGRLGGLLMQAPQMYNNFQTMQAQMNPGMPMPWLPNNGMQTNSYGGFGGYGSQYGQHFGGY
jgi:predicted transglutaminase-like cysteine proteinase